MKQLSANALMEMETKIRYRLHAHDGGHIASLWHDFLNLVLVGTEGCAPISSRVMDHLEDENYHSLCAALVQLDRVAPIAKNWYKNDFLMTMNVEVAP
jgi:hypothetical protein